MNKLLYKDRKFKAWNIERLAEVLCEEWAALNPELILNKKTAYGFRASRISFPGSVHVTVDVSNSKNPEAEYVTPLFNLSLSPDPDDLSTHVLNTFQLSDFIQLFPELSGRKTVFVIGKSEPWVSSNFAQAVQLGLPLLEVLSDFDTCFDFLISKTYKIADDILDTEKLSIGQYLNRVKAYRLAQIYGHLERLNEAVDAIHTSADTNDRAKQDLDRLCAARSPGNASWLYTSEMINALCAKRK
jgi:hypothetical protein